jgi:hypothetical protein
MALIIVLLFLFVGPIDYQGRASQVKHAVTNPFQQLYTLYVIVLSHAMFSFVANQYVCHTSDTTKQQF